MTIAFWDPATWKLRSRLVCKEVQLCLAYSADCDPGCLYTGGVDGSVIKWDLASLTAMETKRAHKGEVGGREICGWG